MTKTLIGNIKGPKGDTGPTPTIGSNGNWFINGVDTNKPSRGVQGPAGQGATTTANATQQTNGLMSYTDKTKLDTLQIVKITKIKDV